MKKIKAAGNFIFILFLSLFVFGCGEGEKHPDVSSIKIDLQSQRFDLDLAHLDTNNIPQGLQQLRQKYPDFLDFYLDTLMGFGVEGRYELSNPAVSSGFRPFIAHQDIRGLMDTVAKHFPDTKTPDEELRKGFQYMKHYYPAYHVPKIIYLISGLNSWSAFTYDTTIVGIGLDMFLGGQYPFYEAVQMPNYVIRKCRPEYIPVNAFQAIYRDIHPFAMDDRTLLDMMIQRGKEQYFLSRVLPFVHDTLRFGYTRAQLEWCEENEGQVYNFFIRDNLLYETNWQKVLRYVHDGPTATGMPAESPGNIGSWIGLQIVNGYVKQHPDISLEELHKPMDAPKFLRESKYKPK